MAAKKQITDAASQYDICSKNKCCRAPNGKKAWTAQILTTTS